MKKITAVICGLSLIVGAGMGLNSAKAEEVKVPVMEQSKKSDVKIPKRGVSKSYVEQRFGTPNNVEGPVGDPPISKWVYNGYTVYFEYDHVIHSVIHHS